VTPAQAKLFERGLLGAETRAAQALDAWESKAGAGDGSALLEIGCGTAPLLIAARERYARVIGIDIAFRWLVMAKKRLQDAGLDLPLICANAESLPFRAETFDRLVADSVLEHVYDQPLVAREGLRVLAADGRLFIATPNRHSLGPDPHVGVWGAGLLPERLLGWYVRRTGGIPPRRQLLSVGGLERLLRSTGYADIRVFLPDVGADQRARFGGVTRMAIDGYHLVKRLPVGGPVLRAIGPLLDAVATRPARPTEAH
jgi:SAM-dependent methyltransferase